MSNVQKNVIKAQLFQFILWLPSRTMGIIAAFMYFKLANCNFMTTATRQNYFMHILLQFCSFLKNHIKMLISHLSGFK